LSHSLPVLEPCSRGGSGRSFLLVRRHAHARRTHAFSRAPDSPIAELGAVDGVVLGA
jgi:hypothetical protein